MLKLNKKKRKKKKPKQNCPHTYGSVDSGLLTLHYPNEWWAFLTRILVCRYLWDPSWEMLYLSGCHGGSGPKAPTPARRHWTCSVLTWAFSWAEDFLLHPHQHLNPCTEGLEAIVSWVRNTLHLFKSSPKETHRTPQIFQNNKKGKTGKYLE